MKKYILPLAVVLILAGAALYFRRHGAAQVRQAAAWVPAGTVIFADLPDLHRSSERWPDTALAQIIAEPEVKALIEKPAGKLPKHDDLDKLTAQLRGIDPTRCFLAVTELSGTSAPKVVAGISYAGNKADLDSLVAELRMAAQKKWPQAKSDIENYGNGEIETFSGPGVSAALAYRGQWLFAADDEALLKETLDRYDGKPGPETLAGNPAFKTSVSHMPSSPDGLVFVRVGQLADRLSAYIMMLSPTSDPNAFDALKKIDAITFVSKMDGELMRDAFFEMTAQPGESTPLTRDVLRLSSTGTIIAIDQRVASLKEARMPDPKSDPSGVIGLIDSDLKIFTDQGLGIDAFQKAFGPESGFVMDWPQGTMIPTPLLMLDVRDVAQARKFLDTLAAIPLAAGVSFTKQDAGGITLYSLPRSGIGFFPLQVTLGLTGKCVIGSLSADAVKEAAKKWDATGGTLANADAFKTASGLVRTPTRSMTYIDTRAIFERLYGLFRGVASMGFVPHLADYIDVSKLPADETIGRHLSPIVASGSVVDGGVLVESAGPVTWFQAMMGVGMGAGAALVPLIEMQIKGQSVPFPGMPRMRHAARPPVIN